MEIVQEEVQAALAQMSNAQLVHFIGGIEQGQVHPSLYWLEDCGCFYGYAVWDKDLSDDEMTVRAKALAAPRVTGWSHYTPLERELMRTTDYRDRPETNEFLQSLLTLAQKELQGRNA